MATKKMPDSHTKVLALNARLRAATKNATTPTALDRILTQQDKNDKQQRVRRSKPVERTARLWMNQGVLAVSLLEGASDVAYSPASLHPNLAAYMTDWVKLGKIGGR